MPEQPITPSVFSQLSAINVNDKTEKKSNLTYLSWAHAWAEVKKLFPHASYEILKFNNLPYVHDPKLGYMVYTTVTIQTITHEMWLPVMDGANQAMLDHPYTYTVMGWKNGQKVPVEKTVDAATMFDINKTIMRCLTKNLAMHGLGIYIYAGEDLPLTEEEMPATPVDKVDRTPATTLKQKAVKKVDMPEPQQAPQQTPTQPSDNQQNAPQQKVQAAATAKAPAQVIELVIDSANWTRVLNYISANKHLGYDAIVAALSSKYTMGPGVKKRLKSEIES